nr:hypothetical protein CFP56_33466 [Quercus suber]
MKDSLTSGLSDSASTVTDVLSGACFTPHTGRTCFGVYMNGDAQTDSNLCHISADFFNHGPSKKFAVPYDSASPVLVTALDDKEKLSHATRMRDEENDKWRVCTCAHTVDKLVNSWLLWAVWLMTYRQHVYIRAEMCASDAWERKICAARKGVGCVLYIVGSGRGSLIGSREIDG